MKKIECPKKNTIKRPHEVHQLHDLVFECSCGEIFEITQQDVADMYTNIVKDKVSSYENQRTKSVYKR
jgi:hypothetical protein